jgi:hypothetical protein
VIWDRELQGPRVGVPVKVFNYPRMRGLAVAEDINATPISEFVVDATMLGVIRQVHWDGQFTVYHYNNYYRVRDRKPSIRHVQLRPHELVIPPTNYPHHR